MLFDNNIESVATSAGISLLRQSLKIAKSESGAIATGAEAVFCWWRIVFLEMPLNFT
jgi:hypothetical protein